MSAVVYAGVGQLAGLLVSPVLTRLYTPAEFGIFGLYMAVFNVLNVAVTLRYEQAYFYERNAKLARGLSWCIALSSAAVSIFAAVVWALLPGSPFGFSHLVVALAAAGAFASGLQRTVTTVLARAKMFRDLGVQNAARPIGIAVLQATGGAARPTSLTLMVTHAIAQAAALVYAFGRLPRLRAYWAFPGWATVRRAAVKHREFPLYNLSQNLLYVLGDLIVPVLLVRYFGATSAGLYWMAYRVTALPTQLFVESARVIVYRDVSRRVTMGGGGARYVVTTGLKLSAVFLLGTAALAVLGPFAFGLVFGHQWAGSGALAPWLMLYAGMSAFAVPFVAVTPLLKLQHVYAAVEALALVAKGAALFAFRGSAGPTPAIIALTLSTVAIYGLFYAFVAWRLTRYRPAGPTPTADASGLDAMLDVDPD